MANQVPSTSRQTLYQAVTAKIVAMIEPTPTSFKAPWHAPEANSLPVNAATQAEYRGVNVLSLWIDAQLHGYPSALWASYRQWQSVGAQVRKGERGSMVVFYRRIETKPADAQDHDRTSKLGFVARASYVFNAVQVDGYEGSGLRPASEFHQMREVEAFVEAVKAKIHHGFAAARYRHDTDAIELPEREWFVASATSTKEQSYYAVLLHELTHWSGARHRLNRQFGKRFGDQAYAFEELVAELGAAFMCAAFGISTEPRPDHAKYVSSWLEVLKRDPKAIFTAASKAQEAFEHLAFLATKNDDPKV